MSILERDYARHPGDRPGVRLRSLCYCPCPVGELRDVRPEEAIRALLAAGGTRRPGKGDHINIKMPNGTIVTLSGLRKPVRIGILKAMLRKAGLSEEQFLDLLGRRRR